MAASSAEAGTSSGSWREIKECSPSSKTCDEMDSEHAGVESTKLQVPHR